MSRLDRTRDAFSLPEQSATRIANHFDSRVETRIRAQVQTPFWEAIIELVGKRSGDLFLYDQPVTMTDRHLTYHGTGSLNVDIMIQRTRLNIS